MIESDEIRGWVTIVPTTHTYDSLRGIVLQGRALSVTEFYMPEFEAAISLGLIEWEYLPVYNAFRLTPGANCRECMFRDGKVYIPIE